MGSWSNANNGTTPFEHGPWTKDPKWITCAPNDMQLTWHEKVPNKIPVTTICAPLNSHSNHSKLLSSKDNKWKSDFRFKSSRDSSSGTAPPSCKTCPWHAINGWELFPGLLLFQTHPALWWKEFGSGVNLGITGCDFSAATKMHLSFVCTNVEVPCVFVLKQCRILVKHETLYIYKHKN